MRYYHIVTWAAAALFPSFAALAEPPPEDATATEEVAASATIDDAGEGEEPLNLAGFMASLFGGAEMSAEDMRAAVEKASAYPLGSEQNPVRVDGPPGERAYLSRLRCENLKRPWFERRGSAGMSPFGGIVDVYEVRCKGSEPAESLVYMDMYHADHFEEQAVPGFGIVGGRSID